MLLAMKPNIQRLEKLATHLESGKLGHDFFNFGVYHVVRQRDCGSSGCALGECPFIFADSWHFHPKDGNPSLRGLASCYSTPHNSAQNFSGLSENQCVDLFYPSNKLGLFATRQQVAANIREFIASL